MNRLEHQAGRRGSPSRNNRGRPVTQSFLTRLCSRKAEAERQRALKTEGQQSLRSPDQKIDESLEESFPASDPPSWTWSRIGSPK
jgi:hypothetical protein